MDEYQEVIDISLKNLNLLGLHPLKPTGKFLTFYQLSTYLIIWILTIAKFKYEEFGWHTFGSALEVTFMLLQSTTKVLSLVIGKKQARHLLEQMKYFLPPTNKNPAIQQENERILKLIKTIVKIFLRFSYLTLTSFVLRPVLLKILPMECLVPPFIPYWLFAIYNAICITFCAFSVLWVDAFFSLILLLLYFQFRMLNLRIAAIDFASVHNEESAKIVEKDIKEIVDHHNFLYDYLDSFNRFASIMALVQCILTIFSVCFELFLIEKNITQISLLINNIMYLGTMSSELLITFGVPAVIVTNEATNVIWNLYNTTWTDCTYLPLRQYLIIMMQRAQKEALVSAGKMVILNLEVCTDIYKAAFSFYAVFKTIS